MRRVVESRQVAHLWANRSQDTARNSNESFYFVGPTIYSYGSHFPIAHMLDDGTILWNAENRSMTTSRHQSLTRYAMTSAQMGALIHVPGMRDDHLRQFERFARDGSRVMPTLVQTCIGAVIDACASMASMREGCSPISNAWYMAKRYETTGRALLARIKGRRPKWPLPTLPNELPTGDALRAIIRAVSRGRLMTEHQSAIAAAVDAMTRCSDAIDGDSWAKGNIAGSLNTAARQLDTAQSRHVAATGRNSGKVNALLRELSQLQPVAEAAIRAYDIERARTTLRDVAREYFGALRDRKARSTIFEYLSGRGEGACHTLGDTPAWVERMRRIAAFNAAHVARVAAERDAMIAQSYADSGNVADATSHYRAAMRELMRAESHPVYCRVHRDALQELRMHWAGAAAAAAEAFRARNASAVADWIAGTRQSLPYSAGTYARIVGDVVETSRGARVPLQHACRLARIARRVIAHGGQTWAAGEGPIVGGFRVTSIDADGRAVIGCHEFEAPEALRMLDALDAACKGCAE